MDKRQSKSLAVVFWQCVWKHLLMFIIKLLLHFSH